MCRQQVFKSTSEGSEELHFVRQNHSPHPTPDSEQFSTKGNHSDIKNKLQLKASTWESLVLTHSRSGRRNLISGSASLNPVTVHSADLEHKRGPVLQTTPFGECRRGQQTVVTLFRGRIWHKVQLSELGCRATESKCVIRWRAKDGAEVGLEFLCGRCQPLCDKH